MIGWFPLLYLPDYISILLYSLICSWLTLVYFKILVIALFSYDCVLFYSKSLLKLSLSFLIFLSLANILWSFLWILYPVFPGALFVLLFRIYSSLFSFCLTFAFCLYEWGKTATSPGLEGVVFHGSMPCVDYMCLVAWPS